jgi:hypothetical protein
MSTPYAVAGGRGLVELAGGQGRSLENGFDLAHSFFGLLDVVDQAVEVIAESV